MRRDMILSHNVTTAMQIFILNLILNLASCHDDLRIRNKGKARDEAEKLTLNSRVMSLNNIPGFGKSGTSRIIEESLNETISD